MAADAGGDEFEGGAESRDLGGEASKSSGVAGSVAVVLDDGAERGAAVEGGSAQPDPRPRQQCTATLSSQRQIPATTRRVISGD